MTFIFEIDIRLCEYLISKILICSVKPEKGNALYWFNVGAQNNLDTRIRHLGCPVSYGDKWILNKWIKWIPNFRNFPCLVNEKHFSVYRNHFESIKHMY